VNFNVYLDDELAARLASLAKQTGAPRNAVIRQAVASWVSGARAAWPSAVLEWAGDASVTPFEGARRELAEPPHDPLDAPPSRTIHRARPRAKTARSRRA
jgi:predicted transcriptional regulator